MSDGILEATLAALIERMNEHKDGALNHSEGDAFQYGKACGVAQGHREALKIFQDAIAADDNDGQSKHFTVLT
jgi:hypothetical protein